MQKVHNNLASKTDTVLSKKLVMSSKMIISEVILYMLVSGCFGLSSRRVPSPPCLSCVFSSGCHGLESNLVSRLIIFVVKKLCTLATMRGPPEMVLNATSGTRAIGSSRLLEIR